MSRSSLPPEATEDWQERLSNALDGSRNVTNAAVDRAECALHGFKYERDLTRSYVRAGLRRELNDLAKAEAVALVAYNGSHVTKSVRLGTKRRRSDGSMENQQVMLHQMSWDELATWLAMIESQIGALLVNREMARKLLALRQKFPASTGPEDACVNYLKTTVEAYLAA